MTGALLMNMRYVAAQRQLLTRIRQLFGAQPSTEWAPCLCTMQRQQATSASPPTFPPKTLSKNWAESIVQ